MPAELLFFILYFALYGGLPYLLFKQWDDGEGDAIHPEIALISLLIGIIVFSIYYYKEDWGILQSIFFSVIASGAIVIPVTAILLILGLVRNHSYKRVKTNFVKAYKKKHPRRIGFVTPGMIGVIVAIIVFLFCWKKIGEHIPDPLITGAISLTVSCIALSGAWAITSELIDLRVSSSEIKERKGKINQSLYNAKSGDDFCDEFIKEDNYLVKYKGGTRYDYSLDLTKEQKNEFKNLSVGTKIIVWGTLIESKEEYKRPDIEGKGTIDDVPIKVTIDMGYGTYTETHIVIWDFYKK